MSETGRLATPDPPGATRAITGLAGAYLLVGGLISLMGWVLDLPRLTDWENDGISTQPNAALATLCAGGSLLLIRVGRRRWSIPFAAMVLFIGGATLLEHLLPLNLGIDT